MTCSVYGCGDAATVGAHVEILNGRDRGHYIVPMCKPCNTAPDEMDLKIGIVLVSANTQFMGCYRRQSPY